MNMDLSSKVLNKTAVIFTAVLLSVSVFPKIAQAQNNDIRAVMNRLNQIENQIQTLSQSVYRDNDRITTMAPPQVTYDGSISEGGNVAAMLNSRLTQIEEEMRDLNGRIEEQNYQLDQLNNQLQRMKEDNELRFNGLENTSSFSSSAPTSLDGTDTLNNSSKDNEIQNFSFDNPKNLYDESFQAIREQNFPRAEKGFRAFLDRYSDHKLAGNAQYWLGETYYVRGDFVQAIQTFAEGYQKYPNGNKAPDNLLKLGVTLAQKDREKDACISLKQLKAEFPNAAPSILMRADKEIERLNCV